MYDCLCVCIVSRARSRHTNASDYVNAQQSELQRRKEKAEAVPFELAKMVPPRLRDFIKTYSKGIGAQPQFILFMLLPFFSSLLNGAYTHSILYAVAVYRSQRMY